MMCNQVAFLSCLKYSCNSCDYQATQKSYLITHHESKHEGKRYPCHSCGYQATEKGSLRKHQKSTRNLCVFQPTTPPVKISKNYHCDSCLYVAKMKWNLDRHQKSKHQGEKEMSQCELND